LLNQLNHQQLPLGLFAEINFFEQRTAMVDLGLASRAMRKMKLIGPADGKAGLRRVVLFQFREHGGLSRRCLGCESIWCFYITIEIYPNYLPMKTI
jgi:hypothetical protein